MIFYFSHMALVLVWIVFLLVAIKLTQFDLKEAKKYFLYALIFMLLVLGSGVKLMFLNPMVAKSGIWLHVKLSFMILLMLENIYLYFKTRELKEVVFFGNLGIFLVMLFLTTLRPF